MTDELDELLWQMWLDEHGEEDFDEHKTKIKQAIQALIADQMAEYQSQLLKDYKDDIAKECNKARIEEMKLAKEWCSGAYLCDYVNILDRIKELSNKENK